MGNLNTLDILALLILLISVVTAIAKGLVMELLSLASVVVGVVLAVVFYPDLASFFGVLGLSLCFQRLPTRVHPQLQAQLSAPIWHGLRDCRATWCEGEEPVQREEPGEQQGGVGEEGAMWHGAGWRGVGWTARHTTLAPNRSFRQRRMSGPPEEKSAYMPKYP